MGAGHRDRICIALEPAQMLKGDIMVLTNTKHTFTFLYCTSVDNSE